MTDELDQVLDHVTLSVADMAAARAFYQPNSRLG